MQPIIENNFKHLLIIAKVTMNSNKNYKTVFSKRLQILLDESQKTQKELAEYTGVSHQAVSQWRNGQNVPDIYKFKKIAEFFGVSYDYLYGDTESRNHENMVLVNELGLSEKAIEQIKRAQGLSRVISAFHEDDFAYAFYSRALDMLSYEEYPPLTGSIDEEIEEFQAIKYPLMIIKNMKKNSHKILNDDSPNDEL